MDEITFLEKYRGVRPNATDEQAQSAWQQELQRQERQERERERQEQRQEKEKERQEKEKERQEKEKERQHALALVQAESHKKQKLDLPCQFCLQVFHEKHILEQHEADHSRRGK